MAVREVSDRYSGQVLGVVWAVGHPLLVMAVYLFVFNFVFRTRIGGTRELPLDYTVYLLSGVIPWITIQEALARTTVSVSSQATLVKQAVFPSEVLPLKSVLSSLLPQAVSTVVLVLYVVATHGGVPPTYALWPLLVVLQVIFTAGLGLLLAGVGVFMRDLKDLVQVFSLIGVYLLPVFYLPSMVPELFRPLLYLNPFSYVVWCYQDALYFGRIDHPEAWVVFAILAPATLYAGVRLFDRLKTLFANVL
jgi:lipopolysaccharide transport system permease protein